MKQAENRPLLDACFMLLQSGRWRWNIPPGSSNYHPDYSVP
jgi:hypothetical protein